MEKCWFSFKNEQEKFTQQIWVKISVKLHTCIYNFDQDNFTFFQSTLFSEEVFQNLPGFSGNFGNQVCENHSVIAKF